jgi:DNA-directed RNA polymerase
MIRAHDAVIQYGRNTASRDEPAHSRRAVDATLLPMTVPPRPWISVRKGSYLISPGIFCLLGFACTRNDFNRVPGAIMRTSDTAFQHFALLSEANHLLGDLFDAVNSLSLVSWNVHQKVGLL